jgi:hypothetical protein
MYIIDLENAYHDTFTDLAILKHAGPCPQKFDYFGIGKVNGFEITQLINNYLVDFFNMYLKDIHTNNLDQFRIIK